MESLLIRFFSPVDVLGFGISIFLSENGALENVSFSALFIDFTREKICAGVVKVIQNIGYRTRSLQKFNISNGV